MFFFKTAGDTSIVMETESERVNTNYLVYLSSILAGPASLLLATCWMASALKSNICLGI